MKSPSARWFLLVGGLVACGHPDPEPPPLLGPATPPAVSSSAASPSAAPTASASPLASASSAPAVEPDTQELSVFYPGARTLHRWQDRHAHSAEFATSDSLEKVKAYYRRYATRKLGYKVSDRPDGSLELDGGAAMGVIWVNAAPKSPVDKRLQGDERTIISSSRP